MIASPRSPLRKPGTRCSVWMSATGTTPPIGPGTTEPAPQRIATALLVDYAGVMTRPIRECHRAWCDVERVDGAALDEALRSWSSCTGAERSPLCLVETGAMPRWDFERELAGQLRRASGTWVEAEGLVDRMLAFFDPDPEMHSLVQRARTSGVRTGLVSNSWGSTQPWDDLRELFDTVVVSCAVGARKPERPILRNCCGSPGHTASPLRLRRRLCPEHRRRGRDWDDRSPPPHRCYYAPQAPKALW